MLRLMCDCAPVSSLGGGGTQTHAPAHMVPGALPLLDSDSRSRDDSSLRACGARFVVVARSPKDVCTSSFYHAWSPAARGWPFDAWAAGWLEGATPSGAWVAWHAGWRAQAAALNVAGHPRVLVLTYEALASPDEAVRLAALRTLGAFVLPRGDSDGFEALVRRVDTVCKFDAMKAQATAATATAKTTDAAAEAEPSGGSSSSHPSGAGHLRHGKAGNWKVHFSLALAARFDAQCGEEARLCGL